MSKNIKYTGENTLKGLISKFKLFFAPKTHSHTKSEITDYVVDDSLSSTSENPVQNKAIHSALAEKIDVNQGTDNAGKMLGIDDSGTVTPIVPIVDTLTVEYNESENVIEFKKAETVYSLTELSDLTSPTLEDDGTLTY